MLTIAFLSRIPGMFLFGLKVIIDGSVKTSSKSLFILNIFQHLFIAFFKPGRPPSYVSVITVLFDIMLFCVFSISVEFEIYCCISFLWYTLSLSLSVSILDCFLVSFLISLLITALVKTGCFVSGFLDAPIFHGDRIVS